eukprot:GHVN01101300.1.p1 GENE.GHVN01101300.1~~GHVN01101300.1.p1  ORF type:complete len:109 (-),score=6.52 GHVN01101300.1:4-330(-)
MIIDTSSESSMNGSSANRGFPAASLSLSASERYFVWSMTHGFNQTPLVSTEVSPHNTLCSPNHLFNETGEAQEQYHQSSHSHHSHHSNEVTLTGFTLVECQFALFCPS